MSKIEESQTSYHSQHWFWGGVLACKKIYGQVAAASVFINLFALASSLYIMTVYDRVIPNRAIESLWALTVIMLVVLVFDFLMKMTRSSFVDYAGARIDRRVSDMLFRRILNNDDFMKNNATGALASVVREFDFLRDLIGSATFTVLVDLPFVLLFILVLFMIGGPVAIVPALIVPAVILVGLLLQPILKRLSGDTMAQGQNKQSLMVEIIAAIKTLRTVRGFGSLYERWMQSVALQDNYSHRMKYSSQLAQSTVQAGQQLNQIGIVVYGVYLINSGDLTMGQLIACVILSGRAMAPLGQVINLLSRFNQAMTSYRNLDQLFNAEMGEKDVALDDWVRRPKLTGSLRVKDIKFSHSGQSDATLDGLSISIKPGEKIALLGKVGSGKSTLLELLAGLYKPEQGHILYDETDIKQLHPDDLRKNVAIALQDPVLFSGSLKENLLMGNPDATDEQLIEITNATGAGSFIGVLPGGFEFPLSERGRELSQGMRQSIAMARALLSEAPVLLLDEPTAALDSGSEQQVVAALEERTKGKTVIFVTHRGALLQLADRIIVMDSGKVVADGPRDELLKAMNKQSAE